MGAPGRSPRLQKGNMGMIRGIPFLALTALLVTACSERPATTVEDEPETPTAAENPVGETSYEEGANVDLWLERLEVGSRELYSAREAVVAAVDLSDGDIIADVGAGTGLYTLLFAEAVGASGRVFAEDIEPLFLDLVVRRASDMGFDNVTAVLGRETSVTLPSDSMDVVFIADSYHYFDDREAIMRTIFDALKPDGSLILVEFDIIPGEVKADYKSHVRFGKAGVVSEIEFIGFEHVETPPVEGLEENYFVKFRKPAAE